MKTERITLVPPSMHLIEGTQAAIKESKTELAEYLGWVQASVKEPEQNMRTAIDNHTEFRNEVRFYILDTISTDVIGAVGLVIRDTSVPFFEIGYWIRNSRVGNGFASEAVGVLEHHAFEHLGANRLEIRAAECNLKSRAVAERCGYIKEALLLNERRLPSGELSSTIVYAKCSL